MEKCTKCDVVLVTDSLVWKFQLKTVCRGCYEELCDDGMAGRLEILKNKYPPHPSEIRLKAPEVIANDGRHDVSDMVIKTLKPVLYEQDHFGMDKYGVPLNFSYGYDWLAMFFEEQADGMKYIQNEMLRRNHVKGLLEYAIETRDWKHVELALKELSISGTGEHKKKTS